jgi:hypothetical protein
MGELDKTIAVVFKRGGKNVMSEMEFVNSIIFNFRRADSKGGFKLDARWAQQVLDSGLAQGFLTKQEGMVKPTFDYREIEVPLNYKPTEAIIAEMSGEPIPNVQKAPASDPEATQATPLKELDGNASLTSKSSPISPVIAQSLFARLVDDISKTSGLKRNEVVAKINRVQEKLGTESIVSALAVARDSGIDITKYLKEAKDEILRS